MDEGGSYPIARVAASERQGVVNVTADRRDAGGRRRRSKTCNWNRGRGRSFVFASFRACESPIERIKPSTVLHTRLLGGAEKGDIDFETWQFSHPIFLLFIYLV